MPADSRLAALFFWLPPSFWCSISTQHIWGPTKHPSQNTFSLSLSAVGESYPLMRYVEILPQDLKSVTLLASKVFADVIKLRWGNAGLRWGLIQWLGSFEEEKRRREGHRAPCDNTGQDWSDVSTNQGVPATPVPGGKAILLWLKSWTDVLLKCILIRSKLI